MKTSKELELEFRKRLNALLAEYNVTISTVDHGLQYPDFYVRVCAPSSKESAGFDYYDSELQAIDTQETPQ